MRSAFITGITGQDGSYLAELLLSKGYEVHGLMRRVAIYPENLKNIEHIKDKLNIHFGDLENEHHLCTLINDIKPDEIYNLASQSDVRVSFDIPEYTGNVTGLGVLRLLEAVRHFSPYSKVYQASSSEMFGDSPPPQNEDTRFNPQSPYACAKVYAHNIALVYRKAYGLFVANGILFNHESPRRGLNFVTRKITNAVAERLPLEMGNLDAKRDWGYAPEYVEAEWLMLQQDKPDDYVIATGETHSVREFIEVAFDICGVVPITINPQFYRPNEVNLLVGDYNKAKRILGWSPKVTFKELVRIMLEGEN